MSTKWLEAVSFTISKIISSEEPKSNIHYIIIYNLLEGNIDKDEFKEYLIDTNIA